MRPQALRLKAPNFLTGGGEMGALIRGHDWGRSPLGPPESWHQSLKTAIRIMLTSRQPIWVGWGEDLIYFYNDAYKSIIGGKHPWALGRPTHVVWSEIWRDIAPMLATAMSGIEGTYVESQLLIMDRNGYEEETYYTFSYSPIPGDGDAASGIICANTDDTKRVIGERQLAVLKELAERTVDARTWQEVCSRAASALKSNLRDLTFALIYTGDPRDGSFVRAGLSGIAEDHVLAPLTIAADDDFWAIGPCLQTGKVQISAAPPPSEKGALPSGAWSIPPYQVATVPIPATAGTGRAGALIAGLNPYRPFDDGYKDFLVLAANQIATAISNAQAYEDERRRAEALAELDRAKSAFFTNISHEFRTPLTLMLGPLEELRRELHHLAPVSSTAALQLDLAHRNGLRLLKLVNTLLDFSRIEAGRMQADFQETDLAAFTEDLASVFRSAIEKAGLRFIVDCPPLPEPAWVDPDMWEKIVLNFISNAFKFTLEGEIEVKVRKRDEHFELSVRDTGAGISPHELSRVFERFHRASTKPGRSHEGSGIGLALVQELVRLHDGSVSVESTEGKGSTFRVLIPSGQRGPAGTGRSGQNFPKRVEAEARSRVEEALHWLPGSEPVAADENPAGKNLEALPRIVLADDNTDMRAYVARLLRSSYAVEEAADGLQALEAIAKSPPDLLLCDVMMPRLDGFSLLRELRAHPQHRTLPIILVSARAGEEARVEGIEAGADDYLVKPFSARELLARIGSTLELARVRREAAERERRLRSEAEAARERFENVLAAIDDLFMVFDHDWRILYVNQQFAALTGRGASELPGENIWDVFPDLVGKNVHQLALDVAAQRKSGEVSNYYERYGRWFRCRLYPCSEGVTAIVSDISHEKRAEARTVGQKQILEMVAAGAPLKDTLDALLLFVESQEKGMHASILLAEENGLYVRRASSPSLPKIFCESFDRSIEGIANKLPYFSPCAEVAHSHTPIFVQEVAEDTRYSKAWRDNLIAGGYSAVRSTGIFGTDGRFLAALSMYYQSAREPNPADKELIDIATHLAAIAIERSNSEAALSESEATLRAFYDNAPVYMGIVERDGDYDVLHIYDNPRACELLGVAPGSTFEKRSIADFHRDVDFVKTWAHHFDRCQETGEPERFEVSYEQDGETTWFAATVCALGRGPSGRMRFCYVSEEITSRKRAEEKQTLLTNELNHRVKNTLAVVQAIAAQTARFSPDPQVFKNSFGGRIAALARVHDVLTDANWTGTSLQAVAQASVSPFNGTGAIRIAGAHADLEPNTAVTLSLAINELATNAAKYGALTVAKGFVSLAWMPDADPSMLKLVWQEHQGPPVSEPARSGFGSLLIERLASQLGGSVTLQYLKEGLRCELRMPVSQGRVGGE